MKILIDKNRIKRISEKIKKIKSVKAFDFYSVSPKFLFPEKNEDITLDYFFSGVCHQFGFWYSKNNKYIKPFIRKVNKQMLKGSDYLWRVWYRAGKEKKDFYKPEVLSKISKKEFIHLLRDDTGKTLMPMIDVHYKIAKNYALDMMKYNILPEQLLKRVNKTKYPVKNLVKVMKKITGYKEDKFQKKLMLLIIVLSNRPEKFLKLKDKQNLKPVVDYHIQRSALRTGIVKITDEKLYQKIINRAFLKKDEEDEIRSKVYKAIGVLSKESGKTIAEIDYFFFKNRKDCPEMTEPECEKCLIKDACDRNIEMFQPIIRTTAY